jgi:peptide/nickel transport system substrate-binding protein
MNHVRGPGMRNKGFLETVFTLPLPVCFVALFAASSACSRASQSALNLENLENSRNSLRFLLDQPPVSLNPRLAVDATGQRIDALLFRGLTRIDANLNAQPDLASSWEMRKDGLEVKFVLPDSLLDHELKPITSELVAQCLENYRIGKPTSPYIAAFPTWVSTRNIGNTVVLGFSKPDPYLIRNISALRYFRVQGQNKPCTEPSLNPLITSGAYFMSPWVPNPETGMLLLPETRLHPDLKPLQISFVEDDNTRVLKLLRGEIDATENTLSLAKTHWLQKNHSDQFDELTRTGVAVGYLQFNFHDPILKDKRIRQAISLGIDRDEIIQNKMYGFAQKAGSLLSPALSESSPQDFPYDPKRALELLKEAGFGPDHRLELHYKSTPVREGFETGLIFKDMLSKIGIDLVVDVVEPAVFLASVKKGNFQLYSSRWLGVADGSILYRTLYSTNPGNRGGYSNAALDRILDQAVSEMDDKKRIALMKRVQEIAADDLPFMPLWFWDTTMIVRKGATFFSGLKPENLSLSGALEPALVLR